MTITYTIENSLYINITNRCTNSCDFCIRNNGAGVGSADNLWLETEPSKEEILDDILKRDLSLFKEIVFCGYGEPLIRLDELLWVSKKVKEISNILIRINTNGHGNLIHNKDITPLFKNIIDVISISLNAKNSEEYNKICHPDFNEKTFDGILDFAAKCKQYVPNVILTIVDTLPKADIEECRKIADNIGVQFRVRELI